MEPYYIYAYEREYSDRAPPWGFALVRRSPDGGFEGPLNIKRYGVRGQIILGQTGEGYFLIDTSLANEGDADVRTFASIGEWKTALKEHGIEGDITLLHPDEVGRTLPDKELHPFDYRRMRGAWGLSDEGWGGLVLLAGFGLSGILGFLAKTARVRVTGSAVLGVVSLLLGPFLIGGAGPGVPVGLIVTPLACAVIATVGSMVRNAIG